jgi:hypothetical protein
VVLREGGKKRGVRLVKDHERRERKKEREHFLFEFFFRRTK